MTEVPEKIDAPESDYLYTETSTIADAGQGLFTAISIYKNEIVSLFKGEILSNEEADSRSKNNDDAYFVSMINGDIMDSKHVDCFAKFANDAEGAAVTRAKNNTVITIDESQKVCLVATRNIKAGEEIFCGYGKRYWQSLKKRTT
ncbi:MAG: SET domain-containing protein-lysine N-methyltransferase [Bacteroidota bacterium]